MKLSLMYGEMDENERVTLQFIEAAPDDAEDPVNFVPTKYVTVKLPPGQLDITSAQA